MAGSRNVASVIQPTEKLVAVLDDVRDANSRSVNDGRARPSWVRSRTGKRGLAIIKRESKESRGRDMAAVLVWQDVSNQVVVVAVLPILADFTVTVSQTDKLSTNGSSTPKTKFLVSLDAPTSPTSPPSKAPFTSSFAFVCDALDSTTTQFIAELKRLHDCAATCGYTGDSKSHDFAKTYLPVVGTTTTTTTSVNVRGGRDELDLATTPAAAAGAKYASPHFDSISTAYSSRATIKADTPAHSSTLSPPMERSISASSSKSTPSRPREIDSPDERVDAAYSDRARDAIEKWVVDRMRRRESEFLDREPIRIWCGTFNVNDKVPRADGSDLASWCRAGLGAELLVFSMQELDLSTEAMLRYTPYREEAWREAIDAAFGENRADYEWLHSKQLVGMLTIVYAKKTIRRHIANVSSATLATGFLGLMANKGVVGIRLRYKDTSLVLLNSHLAAFSSHVQQRNAQYRDIVSQLEFPFVEGVARDAWTPNLHLAETAERPAGEGWNVHEADVLIWMGDLNYRLELPRNEVTQLIEKKDWERLERFDQLKLQKQHRLAFSDFEEFAIDFAPTYKFDRGTNDYDSSEKQRVPSWTDRILWLSLKPGDVSAESYTSHLDCSISDHKPVSAMLRVPISIVDEKRRNSVQQEVIAELAKFDNDKLPDVKILPGPSVEFDTVEYDVPVTKTIEVCNVGQSLAPWSFVLKPGTRSLLPAWLSISPTSGLVVPGERATISLTIHVTRRCAASLNFPLPTAEEPLSDLFVLSIEKKDLFLAVSTRAYRPSVFGSDLEHLARLRHAIASATLDERQLVAAVVDALEKPESERTRDEANDAKLVGAAGVPRAIHQLVNFLAENGSDSEGLFSEEGDPGMVTGIREALDTGSELPLDRLGFSARGTTLARSQEDQAHLRDAVVALERLESDIGSLSLEGTATPPIQSRITTREQDATRRTGVYSVGAVLLTLLESLAEPVIPSTMYARALRCDKREDAYALVQDLPEVHANVLLYLLAFLRVLWEQSRDVQLRASRKNEFAIIFSFVLLREPAGFSPGNSDVSSGPKRRKNFVSWLLDEK